MKKNYLSILLSILCFYHLKSQISAFQVSNITTGTTVVSNDDVFYKTTSPLSTTAHDFELKNTSSNSLTLTVRKDDDLINTVSPFDFAESSFCTGVSCYPSSTKSASLVLTAGETMIFKADFAEASVIGQSSIRYKFTNFSNNQDALSFSLKYNNALSVKNNAAVFSNISGVYPNPAQTKAFIDITLLKSIDGASINIVNALGATIQNKNIHLSAGVHKLPFDFENLNSGVYFIQISYEGTTITKKIIITK